MAQAVPTTDNDTVDDDNGARQRLRTLDALLLTLDQRHEFDALLRACVDRADAIRRLAGPPWNFDASSANWALDQPVSHRTIAGRARLVQERDELRAQTDG